MTFREMLELYQAGALPAPEKELVETELEKHEAISDYLYEISEIPALRELSAAEGETPADADEAQAESFARTVRGAIRRAFLKMGLIVGTVTLAAVLAVLFVLPGLVDRFYYDPNEAVGTNDYGIVTTRMSLDLSVYSELFLPGKYRSYVGAASEGYGVYNLTIPQTNSFDGHFTTVAGRLERGRLTLYNPDLLSPLPVNAFVLPENVEWHFKGVGAAGDAEEAFAGLQKLSEGELYIACFSLAELTDYEELYRWHEETEVGGGFWCAVYDGNRSYNLMGFDAELGGYDMSWDRETYPMLSLLDSRESFEATIAAAASGEAMQTHYISMLRYMADHSELTALFHGNYTSWKDTIGYIEENGLQIYGFVTTADKESIQKLAADERIAYVFTQPLG